MRTIRFYFDVISPNAYLAWAQLPKLAERHECSVHPVPILFAGLLNQLERKGPAEIPLMIRWMWRNCARKAALLGLPFAPPASHPFNPLTVLRIAGLDFDRTTQKRVLDTLFQAVWADGVQVDDTSELATYLRTAGFDGEGLVSRAQGTAAKATLRAATEEAILEGVFGVPTMVVGNQLFWGYDDFEFLERYLAGNDPLPGDHPSDAWSSIQPTARR